MTLNLPEFVEEAARAGAAAECTDLATYILPLIIPDEERRLAAAGARAEAAALPAVSEEVRQRALNNILALRARREAGIPPANET
jgi:hypothetical protein